MLVWFADVVYPRKTERVRTLDLSEHTAAVSKRIHSTFSPPSGAESSYQCSDLPRNRLQSCIEVEGVLSLSLIAHRLRNIDPTAYVQLQFVSAVPAPVATARPIAAESTANAVESGESGSGGRSGRKGQMCGLQRP